MAKQAAAAVRDAEDARRKAVEGAEAKLRAAEAAFAAAAGYEARAD